MPRLLQTLFSSFPNFDLLPPAWPVSLAQLDANAYLFQNRRVEGGYIGVLDNDPGTSENLRLREGDAIQFRPEHIADIATPPREYGIAKYGTTFFDE